MNELVKELLYDHQDYEYYGKGTEGEKPYYLAASDIGRRYYDGGIEVDIDATAAKIAQFISDWYEPRSTTLGVDDQRYICIICDRVIEQNCSHYRVTDPDTGIETEIDKSTLTQDQRDEMCPGCHCGES